MGIASTYGITFNLNKSYKHTVLNILQRLETGCGFRLGGLAYIYPENLSISFLKKVIQEAKDYDSRADEEYHALRDSGYFDCSY